MKKMKKILATMLALACVLTAFPTMETKAATVTVTGGHTTRADAYTWSTYSEYNSIIVELPEGEDDFWVKFTLPKDSKVYASCTYNSENEGMYVETVNSGGVPLDKKVSPGDVINIGTVHAFMAVACDNTTSSTQTFYIHAKRGINSGMIHFTLSIKERIKTGKGTFSFSGTASNSGNNPFSSSGVNSSELTLDLTNNSAIPNKAIVTSVTTSGTQSPSQGNVHHMICPYTKPSIWYTSTLSSATKGRYTIANNIDAKQVWKFKYNALATAKSTMKNVTLTLEWEYDLKDTDYQY